MCVHVYIIILILYYIYYYSRYYYHIYYYHIYYFGPLYDTCNADLSVHLRVYIYTHTHNIPILAKYHHMFMLSSSCYLEKLKIFTHYNFSWKAHPTA